MAAKPTISREVLKWIQSLDLSYAVKNQKRDFANGFLVAEMFSRYYDKYIQMHSFDNGTSMRIRKDNWEQIKRFIKKRGLDLGPENEIEHEIAGVIHAEIEFVVAFLHRMYGFLTGRKVQAPPAMSPKPASPAYQKPTAAQKMKDTLRRPDVAHIQDTMSRELKLRDALNEHQQDLQQNKMADPSRYLPNASAMSTHSTKSVKRVTASKPIQMVSVKKVNVKHVDTNMSMLRNIHKEPSVHNVSSISSSPRAVAPKGPTIAVNDILSGCIIAGLPIVQQLGTEAVSTFIQLLQDDSTDVTDPQTASVIRQIETKIPDFVTSSLANPKEFWNVLSFLFSTISIPSAGTDTFEAAINTIKNFGGSLLKQNALVCGNLFDDHALHRCCQLLKKSPVKRISVLESMVTFLEPKSGAYIKLIRSLQSELNDMTSFIHCLSIISNLIPSVEDELADLLLYYCVIGLGLPAPSARSNALVLMTVVAKHNPTVVLDYLTAEETKKPNPLVSLCEDEFWEIKGQLLVLIGTLMEFIQPGPRSGALDKALKIIETIFIESASPSILQIGLSSLAPHLKAHSMMVSGYLKVLLSLPDSERRDVLFGDNLTLCGGGAKSHVFHLKGVRDQWDATGLAVELATFVQREELDHLDPEHVQILLACVMSPDCLTPADMPRWTVVFDSLKDYLYVSLCDGTVCDFSTQILLRFAAESSVGAAVWSSPSLLGALRLLIPAPGDGDMYSQEAVGQMFLEGSKIGPSHRQAVSDTIQMFANKHNEQYNGSTLEAAMKQM
eukprot:TRINITY_DN779889_c0_g1_i1.p1 TRINITY_DN779889_c0_g1~~TRINITY_DN779889_c0_g1_i1.p1  ORF type:complete len:780 (+),score=232.23 TRINITY_DN779889_c0_g1_i1:130-2469(+)